MIVGVDIGGSHITAALIDAETNRAKEHSVVRNRINSHGSANEILDGWCRAINEVWQLNDGLKGKLGIAMPGPFDYARGISLIKGFDKYEALYQLNIREALAERLSIAPGDINFVNDASAFLLGEVTCGAAMGFNKAIGITLGTGLGSAVSNNGKTHDAELSVIPFHDSWVEEYISTRWFLRRYKEITGAQAKDVKEIADRVPADHISTEIFTEFSNNLSSFLHYFMSAEHADVLIIGGNIANAWHLFYHAIATSLHTYFPDLIIKQAQLGEEAALIGGALSWKENE